MSTENTVLPPTPMPAPAAESAPAAAPEPGGALAVLETFFAAEAAYVAAGGRPGGASFAELAACLDPDVVMYQSPGLPYGGPRHGPSGIEDFMAAMSEAWQDMEFLEQRFAVDGDSVAILNHGLLTARATGRVLDTWVMQMITIRNGLIIEIRPFYWDTKAVDAALTP
ncbi:nuclear transport factor 2 family protein (plasmid) [Embleya sp. NBC_00888]|uniref:nuclear transport factor 2 family protein n=1 Tax=Embleya sp. NBC_00888 TaxID=2975960 RepID=UPI002F919F5F|nr:nuclear transport factor 2 family protein [Embleya sp. NBC_00888]